MDFSKFNLSEAAAAGATMVVRHPVTDEDLIGEDGRPVTITVLGQDSRKFKARVDFHLRSNERSRKSQSLAQMERQSADMLAHATVAWEGIEWEGQELEFSIENATMLYEKCGWLRKQVDEFVTEPANFFKDASQS